jgi:hypothetical protein
MISFEVKKPKDGSGPVELDVFLDEDGAKTLLRKLEALLEKRTDHVHMFSTSWGGYDLEDEPKVAESYAIRHVKMYLD